MYYVNIAIIVLNILVFALYGIDKWKSRHRKRRIREITLILPLYVFSAVGAMLGMIVFNHKTSKTKFRVFVPLAFVFNIICAVALKKLL